MSSIPTIQGVASTAVDLTKARLELVLREARKDEARLSRILELRRLKRRLRSPRVKSSTNS